MENFTSVIMPYLLIIALTVCLPYVFIAGAAIASTFVLVATVVTLCSQGGNWTPTRFSDTYISEAKKLDRQIHNLYNSSP